jgi:hypothetical protein
MINRDAIELALAGPIDWEKFESLVAEILQSDDSPRLRKVGGRGDLGIDAVDEAFYNDESRIQAVVQVTSQRAQVDKIEETVKRLRSAGVDFFHLVMVLGEVVGHLSRANRTYERFSPSGGWT